MRSILALKLSMSSILVCAAALLLIPAQAHTKSFIAISAGGQHSLALKDDGSLWAWGDNFSGQVGDGSMMLSRTTPSLVGEDFVATAAGARHSFGLKADGTLWAWGYNLFVASQLGDGTTTNRFTPVQVGEDFSAVAGGSLHSLGLKTDGSLWAWGINWAGQLGDGTDTSYSIPVHVDDGYIAIDAGDIHSLGLKTDGSLWVWGGNTEGQLGDGTTTECFSPKKLGDGFVAIAAGDRHSLALKSGGSLWAWGSNGSGQLGDGTTDTRSTPVFVGQGFKAISAGISHSLGVKEDGSLWAWGENSSGQLGDGTTTDSLVPVQVGEGFTAVSAGESHSLGVKANGSICAWGSNNVGQLGTGSTTDSLVPALVSGRCYYIPYVPGTEDFNFGFGLSNMDNENTADIYLDYFNNNGEKVSQDFRVIPANGHLSFMSNESLSHSGWVRIASSNTIQGTALVYGYGEDPLFDMDFKSEKSTHLAAAHVDTGDGWVSKAMLANPGGEPARVLITIYSADGGDSHTAELVIPAMGSAQYNLDTFGYVSGSIRISADQEIVGFLLYDGRAKGSNWAGGLSLVPSNMYFTSTAAGLWHTLGLESDSALWAWGSNSNGQLGSDGLVHFFPAPVEKGFLRIAAGNRHSLGLKDNGSLWAWGRNFYGQLGDGTTSTRSTPVQVGGDFAAVTAGGGHSLGLKTDGTLWAWGWNSFGQLGNSSTDDSSFPVQVAEGFSSIAAGNHHSLGLKTDGSLWAWGDNDYGQLGDGATTDRHIPVRVGEGFVATAAGWYHSLGLKADNSLWAWGRNDHGQLGDGATADRLEPVQVGEGFGAMAAGEIHSLGLKSDGSLLAWGDNGYGQLGDGTTVERHYPVQVGEGFACVNAGTRHSLGLKVDGSLWTWGDNTAGQLGDGTKISRSTPVRVGKGFGADPNEQGEYVYFIPYAPDSEDFDLGWGIANGHNVLPADVTVEYYSNAGAFLGQETAAIQPYSQTSFMCGVALDESGWARIVSDQPLYGLALGVGYGDDPLFDMDFKPATAATLTAAHVDTSGGWRSKAMLANPNNVQADVTVTFHPDDGLSTHTVDLTIPAMGAVQYDLAAAFPGMTGAIKVASDQGLVGFLLYDGRGVTGDFSGFNYVGGLSMVAAD